MAQRSIHIPDIISNGEQRAEFIAWVEKELPPLQQKLQDACRPDSSENGHLGKLAHSYATLYALKLMHDGSPDGSTLIAFLKDTERPKDKKEIDVAKFDTVHSNLLQIAWKHTVSLVGDHLIQPESKALSRRQKEALPPKLFGKPIVTARGLFSDSNNEGIFDAREKNLQDILVPIFKTTKEHFREYSDHQDTLCAKLDTTLQVLADKAKAVIKDKYAEFSPEARTEANAFFLGVRTLHYAYSIGGTAGMIATIQAGEHYSSHLNGVWKKNLSSLSSKSTFKEAARCALWEWKDLSRKLPVEEINTDRRMFLSRASKVAAGFAFGVNSGLFFSEDMAEADSDKRKLLALGSGLAAASVSYGLSSPSLIKAAHSHDMTDVLYGVGSLTQKYSQMETQRS